jgi:subtilisin-like proprotein convertase family protein
MNLHHKTNLFYLNLYRQISAVRPLEIDFEVKGCEGENNVVRFLEHIQLYVTIKYTRRGALKINITSPHGRTNIFFV